VAKRTASAKKQARSGARRAERNRAVRSEVKTLVVKARRALSDGQAESSERMESTMDSFRALDRAGSKRVLHRNNAARRKSRLAKRLAKVAAAAPPPATGKGKKAATPAPTKKK
jgi:small subunit ribosomal protein S20